MDNRVRLYRQHDELVFFLKPNDISQIHNRMIKHNVAIKTRSPLDFLGRIIKNTKNAVPKNGYQYHGEFNLSELDAISSFIVNTNSPTLFNSKDKWNIPKGYKFHEVGVCLNDTLQDNKFGNVEIKFVKEDCVIVPKENPDFMIVINVHLVDRRYENSGQLVFGSLADKKFHKDVNDFFKHRSLTSFNHDDDIAMAKKNNFRVVEDTKSNFTEYTNVRKYAKHNI